MVSNISRAVKSIDNTYFLSFIHFSPFLVVLKSKEFNINYCIEDREVRGKFDVSPSLTLRLDDFMISLTKHHGTYHRTTLAPDDKQAREFYCFQSCFQAYCFHPLHLVYIRDSERLERLECFKRFIARRDGGAPQTKDGFIDFGCGHTPYCHLGGPFKDLSNPRTKRVDAKDGSNSMYIHFSISSKSHHSHLSIFRPEWRVF